MLNINFQVQLFAGILRVNNVFESILRSWRKMIQLLLYKATLNFQLLPVSKVDQS